MLSIYITLCLRFVGRRFVNYEDVKQTRSEWELNSKLLRVDHFQFLNKKKPTKFTQTIAEKN